MDIAYRDKVVGVFVRCVRRFILLELFSGSVFALTAFHPLA
jgi:hypothetical protein